MAVERLHVDGPCPAWRETALSGRWGDQAVWIAVGERGRAEQAAAVGPMEQPLVALTELDDRGAWLYAASDGASLQALIQQEPPSMRVVAEAIATLARALHDAEEPLYALPGLTEVLVRPTGELRWIGLGPIAATPLPDAAEVVYALGNIGMALISGAPVPRQAGAAAHAAAVRRALIRAVSRPGPSLPERLRDWIAAMLSFRASQRPTLRTTALVMSEVARGLPSPGLHEWAAVALDVTLGVLGAPPLAEPLPTPIEPGLQPLRDATDEHIGGPAAQPTLMGDQAELPEHDDPTAVSNQGAQPWSGPPERGTIPVKVGPPPEAVLKPTRLPEALFSEEGGLRQRPERSETDWLSQLPFTLPSARAVTVVGVGLSLLAVALALYLF